MSEALTATVPPLAAFLRPQLPPAALYGLPGEVATTLAESSGADPAAVLVGRQRLGDLSVELRACLRHGQLDVGQGVSALTRDVRTVPALGM